MSSHVPEDDFFDRLAAASSAPPSEEPATPSRLKARLYTSLIHLQQTTGPLEDVSTSKRRGSRLCVFEELVQIAPISPSAKAPFFCGVCHARFLAENFDNAPIWWSGCPYVDFQNR